MGAIESTARTNGGDDGENSQNESGSSSMGGGKALAAGVAAVGVVALGISRMLSENTDSPGGKMMKAPGQPNKLIPRDVFEGNPRKYFADHRGKH